MKVSVAIAGASLFLLALASNAATVLPSAIEIFTNDKYPVRGVDQIQRLMANRGIEIRHYNLDQPKEIQAELNKALQFPRQARTPAKRQRVWEDAMRKQNDPQVRQIVDRLRDSYNGAVKAGLTYELKKLPAVVFDHGAGVVYGVSDLATAVKHYGTWKRVRGQ
jgi:integrating conjugative element protein (TIGR03757 family)